MMMSDIKVGDIVSVEQWQNDGKLVTVGKIYSISGGDRPQVGIQVGHKRFKQFRLSDCWNATPTQKKYFFKELLNG